jgi:GDP-L-fucose synthase
MKQTILVTGSNGMLGTSLQKVVADLNFCNNFQFIWSTRQDLDLVNNTEDERRNFILEFSNVFAIIHLAAKVGGVYENSLNNYLFYHENTKINATLVELCKKLDVKLLINILSTCIFPDKNVSYPLTSDQILNGPPHYSNIGYSYAKRNLMIESNLLSQSLEQFHVVNIIPTNLYGVNDNTTHVIPDICKRMKYCKQHDTDFYIHGSGKACRQFLLANDLSKIILSCLLELPLNKTFIVSPKEQISIMNLTLMIAEILDFTGTIHCDTTFSDGQLTKTATHLELLKNFPNFEFTSLKKGLDFVTKSCSSN